MVKQFLIGFSIDVLPIIMGAVIFIKAKNFFMQVKRTRNLIHTKTQKLHRLEHLNLAWKTVLYLSFYVVACGLHLYADSKLGFQTDIKYLSFQLLALFPLYPLILQLDHITKEEGGELSYYSILRIIPDQKKGVENVGQQKLERRSFSSFEGLETPRIQHNHSL